MVLNFAILMATGTCTLVLKLQLTRKLLKAFKGISIQQGPSKIL